MRPTKGFSKLMRDISSSVHKSHYCFGCFHSFKCNSTLEKHTRLCKDHDFCKINLPDKKKNIKEHKYGSKSLRMNDIIYVDLESLLVKYDICLNDPNKSHTVNIAQHISSGYSITILRNHSKSTEVTFYRGEDCIQKLCSDLKNISTKLFDTEKFPMTSLTTEQKKQHMSLITVSYVKRNLITIKKVNTTKILEKLKILIITQVNTEMQHILNVI